MVHINCVAKCISTFHKYLQNSQQLTANNKPTPNVKFLGIYIYITDTINWKYHIKHILPNLSAVCYVMRSIKPYMSLNTLRIVYYYNFNSVVNYGLQFWGNSPRSIKIFRMQENTIRIVLGCKKRVSCRNLFRKLKILPLESQYILSLLRLLRSRIRISL